jgi:adenylylsulfate kinase
VLDGDNIRHGLCADLGFSVFDRNENVRRAGEVAKLFLDRGVVVFVALISPIRSARDKIRQSIPDGDFVEIYCNCPLPVCKERDPKGQYAKAENGTIVEFTGISSPYEAPVDPALTLDTGNQRVEESVARLTRFVLSRLEGTAPR